MRRAKRETSEARVALSGRSSQFRLYVKVDAGLGRLGVPLSDAAEFIRAISALENVVVGGIYTHLPFAGPGGVDWARRRLADFDGLLDTLHSAGLSIPVTQARGSSCIAAVRAGVAAYHQSAR